MNLLFFLLLAALPPSSSTSSQYSESIVVSAIRADDETPVTKTDIPKEEIEKQYHGQDVPLLLREAPSVNAYTESGVGGSGYSYISLRGVSPTRINFTLDGVPLADSEDMGTYFADFPDLSRSLESIQIQRGVGTSTFGSPSFGGSVNMESLSPAQDQKTSATLGIGSFGNRQASVGYQSGQLPSGFALYTRLSYLENDGFRDNSGIRQHNAFLSAAKNLGDAQLRLTGFSGHEDQQLAFYATDADTLKTNLRANPLRPDEKDSFGYDLAQLQWLRANMTASVYYQRGYGWYRLFDSGTDVLREYGLDGMLLGTLLTYSKTSGALTTNYGVHLNRFQRDHTRDDLSVSTRDYANYGVKGEANAFAKATYDLGAWHLYGDAQLRHTEFDYHGDVDIPSISWTFFNPKIGARYDLSSRASVYASAGMSTREPTRNDMFQGEDNASFAHDLRAVRPERLYDFEAGWNYRAGSVDLAANVYAMEFRNEIASTGELSDIGLLLRRNVDRSYRRGIELDFDWRATPRLRLKTNANVSRNRINEWTQFFDLYDADFNYTGARAQLYRNVQPLLTPNVLVNQSIEYAPLPRLSIGGIGRYVGRSYLDNTNDSGFDAPSFFVLDGNVSYAITPAMRVSLQVNNALNERRVYPNGYSYRFDFDGAPSGTAYFYPQATRNAVLLMDFAF
jgi:iron complex outermembrane receptor protein